MQRNVNGDRLRLSHPQRTNIHHCGAERPVFNVERICSGSVRHTRREFKTTRSPGKQPPRLWCLQQKQIKPVRVDTRHTIPSRSRQASIEKKVGPAILYYSSSTTQGQSPGSGLTCSTNYNFDSGTKKNACQDPQASASLLDDGDTQMSHNTQHKRNIKNVES